MDEEPKNVFGVDQHTGYVRVYSILDRERIAYYQVKTFSHVLCVNTLCLTAWILNVLFV